MSDDGDPCTGVEINDVSNEACKMDCSKSFTPSKSKSDGKERLFRYVVANAVILLANTLVLAASGACVIVALVEISQLKSEVTGLSTLQQGCSGNQIALQIQELLMFQQNVSDVMEAIATNLDRSSDDLSEFLQDRVPQLHNEHLQLRIQGHCPLYISSCSSLLSYNIYDFIFCPSGYYFVRTPNGTDVRVFCDMHLQCGGVTGGWMRVADTYHDCPSGFVESNETGIHQCRVRENGCFSVNYPTFNISYSTVCGAVTAYQLVPLMRFEELQIPLTLLTLIM